MSDEARGPNQPEAPRQRGLMNTAQRRQLRALGYTTGTVSKPHPKKKKEKKPESKVFIWPK